MIVTTGVVPSAALVKRLKLESSIVEERPDVRAGWLAVVDLVEDICKDAAFALELVVERVLLVVDSERSVDAGTVRVTG